MRPILLDKSEKLFFILASTVVEKFDPKPSESAFLTDFRDNLRAEVVSDIISDVTTPVRMSLSNLVIQG